MGKVFAYQGPLWRILNCLTDILFLSVLWVFCSLPVITLGASATALYDSAVHCIRYKEENTYRRFFNTFRSNFRVSALSTLLWLAVSLAGVFVLMSLRQLGQYTASALAAAAAWYVVLLLPIGSACWAFPILSRFTFNFKSLNVTAFKFALGHLPSTAIIVLLVLEGMKLCLEKIYPFLFAPAVLMLLMSLFIEPVFQKHGGGITKEEKNTEE